MSSSKSSPPSSLLLLLTSLLLFLSSASSFSSPAGFGAKKSDPMATHDFDSTDGIKFLKDFVNKNGGNTGEKCEVTRVNGGIRGIVCTHPLKKDEIIMSLPSSLALSLWDPSTKSETPPTATDCAVNFKEWYLDDENRLNTFAPYIGILPTPSEVELDVTPDYYSENETKMLEFPKIIESINQRNRDIEKSSTTTELSPSDLKYYTYLVTSRSFNIRLSADDKDSNNVKGVRIMLPFLDLLNHGGQSNAELDILNPEKDDSTFVIRAKRPIQPGKEITLTYGSGGFSSVDLFSSYGFVPSGVEGRDEKNVKVGGKKRRPVTADERTMAKLETEEGYVSPWSTSLEEDVERIKEGAEGRERKILEFRAKMKVAGGWPVGVMDGKMDLKKKEGGGK